MFQVFDCCILRIMLNINKGPSLGGILGVLRKVGVGRVALAKLRVIFKVNGKAAASCLEYLVELLLFRFH